MHASAPRATSAYGMKRSLREIAALGERPPAQKCEDLVRFGDVERQRNGKAVCRACKREMATPSFDNV